MYKKHTTTNRSFDFNAYVFGLIRPPRYPGMWRLAEAIMSILFVLGFGAAAYGLVNILTAYQNGHLAHWLDIMAYWDSFMIGSAGLLFLGYPIAQKIWGRGESPDNRFEHMGDVQISPQGFDILYNGELDEFIPINDIYRIDVYYYLGFNLKDDDRKKSPAHIFQHIDSLRLRLKMRDGRVQNLYVQNNSLGNNDVGALYTLLKSLRKVNLHYHRHIQFWGKI